MAQKAASGRNYGVPTPARPRARWRWVLIAGCLPILAIVSIQTVVIALIGMMPTIVAAVVDRTPQKYALLTVGASNSAGVFPYVMALWTADSAGRAAAHLLTDFFPFAVMYTAAACGWLLYFGVPQFIMVVHKSRTQKHIARLRQQQADLLKKWGEGVSLLAKHAEVGIPTGATKALPGQSDIPSQSTLDSGP